MSRSVEHVDVGRELLAAALSEAQFRLQPAGQRLTKAAQRYAKTRGRHRAQVIREIHALQRANRHQLKRIRHVHVTRGSDRRAQKHAVHALILLGAGLGELHTAYSSGSAHRGRHASELARRHLTQATRLERKVSKIVGFTWEM